MHLLLFLSFIFFLPFSIQSVFSSDEVEGSLKSEYLLSCRYNSITSDWTTKGIKEKAKIGCQYAFQELNSKLGAEFFCEEIAVGRGAISGIAYQINPKTPSSRIEHSPPIESLKILANYHFRKDGKLPYYKDEVFSRNWIESRCANLGIENFRDLYVVNIVSVIDEINNINLYVVSKNDENLNVSSWILRKSFNLFEGIEDDLQTELCVLLQKISFFSSPKKVSPPKKLGVRLEEVEKNLEELKHEE
jgi:hypothetical protein